MILSFSFFSTFSNKGTLSILAPSMLTPFPPSSVPINGVRRCGGDSEKPFFLDSPWINDRACSCFHRLQLDAVLLFSSAALDQICDLPRLFLSFLSLSNVTAFFFFLKTDTGGLSFFSLFVRMPPIKTGLGCHFFRDAY